MVGETLSHYRILETLGSGGMGEVYVAKDTPLGRQCGPQRPAPEAMGPPGRGQRFEREAKALAALAHPNIVTVYSLEHAEGVDFITMELVRDKALSQLIPKGAGPGRALRLAIPLAARWPRRTSRGSRTGTSSPTTRWWARRGGSRF